MKTYSLTTNKILLSNKQTAQELQNLTMQLTTGKRINEARDDSIGWVKSQRSRSSAGYLDAINTALNSVATNIRIADSTMETIGQNIEQMQGELGRLLQDFLTYPPKAAERNKVIDGYNTIRSLIGQLTEPPNDRGALKIMADPSKQADAGDWKILVGENQFPLIIHSREVHAGPTGLDIPELAANASDDEIEATLEKLKTAKSTLGRRREGLALDAETIPHYVALNTKYAELYRGLADDTESANILEVSAKLKSVELMNALSIESIGSIIQSQANLLTLWR